MKDKGRLIKFASLKSARVLKKNKIKRERERSDTFPKEIQLQQIPTWGGEGGRTRPEIWWVVRISVYWWV